MVLILYSFPFLYLARFDYLRFLFVYVTKCSGISRSLKFIRSLKKSFFLTYYFQFLKPVTSYFIDFPTSLKYFLVLFVSFIRLRTLSIGSYFYVLPMYFKFYCNLKKWDRKSCSEKYYFFLFLAIFKFFHKYFPSYYKKIIRI